MRIYRAMLALFLLANFVRGAEKDPPPISLHLTDVNPREALDELEKQTGVKLAYLPDIPWASTGNEQRVVPRQISIDLDNKSFWTCMQEICVASKLDATARGDGDDITIEYNDDGAGVFAAMPTSVGPAATFGISSIRHHVDIDFANFGEQPQRDIAVELTAWVDPRLHMIQCRDHNGSSAAKIETAVDENGASILAAPPPEEEMTLDYVTSPWAVSGITVPLDYESGKSKKLATLKGSVRIVVATATEKLEVDDLPSSVGHEKTVAGMHFVMTDVTVDGQKLAFAFTIERNDMEPEVWKRATDGLYRTLRVQLADGTIINPSEEGLPSPDPPNEKLTLKSHVDFTKDSERPVKLIWEIPTAVEERDLPFEFKDLPLP